MSTLIKYIIIILIALLIGWNIRISTDDNSCKNGICPAPQEYRESEDTTEIKSDYKELYKQVNTNREHIASQKSIIKTIETFLVGIGLAVVGLFIGKYK